MLFYGGDNMGTHKLHPVIDALSYPANGNDFLREAQRQGLPNDFIEELKPMISGKTFNSAHDLERWVANNVTAHMAGLLGGASVQELIARGKKVA